MTRFALYVELKAKQGREEDVANFLASARSLVMAEAGTVAWFAVRFDRMTFAIFDAFNDEAGREGASRRAGRCSSDGPRQRTARRSVTDSQGRCACR